PIGADPGLGPEFPRPSQPDRPSQAQLVPEPADPLEVDHPTAAEEHRMDAAIAVARVPPRQPLDLADRRRLIGTADPAVPQAPAGPPQDPAGPPLRGAVALGQVAGRRPLLIRGHHFFLRGPGASAGRASARRPGA